MSLYDLMIVGDGVAANAALISLSSAACKLRVALIASPKPTSSLRIGEHLSASANATLQDLGLWDSFVTQGHLECLTTYAAWGSDEIRQRNAFGDPRGSGWALDRHRFEEWLRGEARKRLQPVEISGSVAKVEQGDGITVGLRGGGIVKGRFVLDASGRAAAVARHFCTRERLNHQVAVYNAFEQVDTGVEPSIGPLVEALPGGWFYSALLPGRRLLVAWFTDRSFLVEGFRKATAAAWWRRQVEASRYTALRIETAGYTLDRPLLATPSVADAGPRFSNRVAGEGWAAAGDAAAAFDPLSSHGMTTALWSGKRSAEAIHRWVEGDVESLATYERDYLDGMERHRREAQAIYASEQRFEDAFWRSRQSLSSEI